MKYLTLICASLGIGLAGTANAAGINAKLTAFPVENVRLTPSAFKDAQDADIRYLLALDPDRLIAPYRAEAGLPRIAENYPNWENTGLNGHIGGHYLSALAFMYASTGNKEIGEKLDYTLRQLKECQDAAGDGYLCGAPGGRKIWKEVSEGNIRAGGFSLNEGWVPLYNIHKIFAGLRDAYQQCGREDAKKMLIKLTDWFYGMTSNLTDEQIQDMLRSEHGGLNEVFADAAVISGDDRYMDLARRFSHRFVLDPLIGREDRLTGMHANTQIPKVIGFKRIADIDGNSDWDAASRYFWDIVTSGRTISIGGNSVREHFHPSDDFSSMLKSEQGPETCNTYNMLRLTKMLYETTADVSLMDYYERALYNHILSSENAEKGGFVYFTPMRSGHYRVYSQPETSFWCCVGSGLENHARYGEMIYSHTDNDFFANLYIPSRVEWGDVTIEQSNNFPESESTDFVVTLPKKKSFAMNIRIPGWLASSSMAVTVNGSPVKGEVKDGFYRISRKWKNGDKVHVELPMTLSASQLPDGSPNYSFLYGPIVLAANLGEIGEAGVYADDSRGGHIAAGRQLPLNTMPVLVGEKNTLLDNIKKDDAPTLSFTMSNVASADGGTMKLEPFNRMHDCRYMVYWELLSRPQLQARRAAQAEEERIKAELDAVTVDHVVCGEQQPESDHFIAMEGTFAGNDEDLHWRKARRAGWFSYKMKASADKASKLRVAFEAHPEHAAAILAEGTEIGVCHAPGENGIVTKEFDLPEELRGKENILITIKSHDDRETPKIYETRLIK